MKIKEILKRLLLIFTVPILIFCIAIFTLTILLLAPFYWIIIGKSLLNTQLPKFITDNL